MKYNIQLVGVGGQGVLLASTVLGNAAVADGLEVAMSEVHGMAQRGGSVQCSVRMGQDILSPLIPKGGADLLLGFEPAETLRNVTSVDRDSWIITNTSPVIPISVSIGQGGYPPLDDILAALRSVNDHVVAVDATARAVEAGRAITANAVLIGAMTAVKGFPLSKQRVLDALLEAVPAKAKDVNVRAFELGYEEVRGE
ncbi:MAG: indolepyruvate ferredoxin oxidoreductase subunit beta [Methanomassiliicoccaceae archaeon]|jgi:indolepyruvate ferredoxin oxidoreductase beta subunit|nr:indolepyruvate ferredoxin oxidoreductase subunit beta [Euryarchaeota archaeon]HOB37492.1 indolepyruvate ferredoxin oxidoreductase subunit beta [Methanomassiliicoccaceae archaeon]HOL07687.1 indolepyruvate ferredoxin oxidoreductase subunit beta [Methanomassiliicoccaceae archaeon]HOQ26113.1 indolepyruvate ferredoxin oxidoreductase subunit beta [Methanomassiliicoccaceae archaeon]HQD87731.1 indolepyruvate ferredoxin oxidoreductase subunit beta [Methanomassiliicoccaceae archaeon]